MKPLLRSFQPTKVPVVAPVTLLGLIVLLATSLVAQAELETHWIADFGKYSAATNWSTGAVPNNDASTVYSVVINQGTVFVDQSAIISSLRIGMNGALVDRSGATIANSTLTADTMVNEGTINDFRGLVLNVSGDVFNSGTITVQLGRAAATLGNTYNSGFIGNTSQGGFLTVNGTLTNEGGVRNGSSFVVNGDLNNTGTVSGDIQSNTSITGDVYNNDTLGLSGRAQIGGNVENHGTMSTAGPASSVGALNSDGILRIASRALNAGEIVTSGTMSLGSRIFTSAFEQQEAGLWRFLGPCQTLTGRPRSRKL